MSAVLRDTACPACGHHHNFARPFGELALGHLYEFVCPETGQRARLRPDQVSEFDPTPPQGAVVLEAVPG